jgi:AraC-like DNA-binding protein
VDELRSSDATPHPVGVRRIRCDHATHVRLPDEGAGYIVAVPVNGAVEVMHRARTVEADSDRAVVFRPEADIDMSCGEGFSCYAVTIDTTELQNVLERRLGHTVRRPPELAVSLDLTTPAGRAWAGLIRLLVTSPLLRHPLLAAAAQETLVARLLLALDHPYRDELDAPVHSWGPGPVRRMVDVIEAEPRHPFTVAELSDVAGVSVPALRECCRRHRDHSPADELRSVRLTRARRELEQADAGWSSVAGVASSWGFVNQGRFVDDFGNRYHEPPWLTLRGPAYA